ncbi:MAG TPA: hypothetical protein VFV50_01305, partial [Bdellovibrionales bacterium]|nr:hypothetical protein [Bdellovibrionales bacterium]
MKRLIMIILMAIVFEPQLASAGGGLVGNGGDVIECKPAPGSPFDGLYSLDYLLTYQASNVNADVVVIPNLTASVTRLRRLLAAKLPTLLESFDSFTRHYLNTKDKSAPRFWEEAPFGLVDLKDENMVALVPPNCRDGSKVRISQAMIRQFPSFSGTPQNTIVYKFVPQVISLLDSKYPLQLSFLYVHEWLWDVSQNVDRNRRLNRYFHSAAFEAHSAQEARAAVIGMGLTLPDEMPPVYLEASCLPAPATVPALLTRKPTGARFVNIGTASVHQRSRICFEDQGCEGSWTDQRESIAMMFGQHPINVILFDAPWRVELWSRHPRGDKMQIARCELEAATGRLACTPVVLPTAEPYAYMILTPEEGYKLKPRGGLTSDCLRLT